MEPLTVLVTVPWSACDTTSFFTVRCTASVVAVSVFSALLTKAVTLVSWALTFWAFRASSLMVYFRVKRLSPSTRACGVVRVISKEEPSTVVSPTFVVPK